MNQPLIVLAALLALAAVIIAVGVAMVAVPAGIIVGGLLLAGWAFLVFLEVRG